MRITNLEQELSNDASLPMLPQVVVKVQTVVSADDSSARDLASVILSDPMLTSRVLKLVNSAYHSVTRQKVTKVTQAIVVLGFERIRNLTLALSSYKILRHLQGGKALKKFWIHSLATAIGTQLLAPPECKVSPEEMFVGGLLHDVGKLILAHYYPEEYQKVLDKMLDGKSAVSAEFEVFEIDHRDAGLALANVWGFPPLIHSAIRYHHDLKKPGTLRSEAQVISGAVGVANLIAKNLYGTHDPEQQKVPVEKIVEYADELLGLGQAEVDDVVNELGQKVEEMAGSLGISLSGLATYADKGFERAILSDEESAMADMERERALERRRVAAIHHLTLELTKNVPFPDYLADVLKQCCEAFGFEMAIFAKVSQRQKSIEGIACHGARSSQVMELLQVALEREDGMLATSVLEGRALNVLELAHASQPVSANEALARALGRNNLVLIPVSMSGRVIGVIVFSNNERVSIVTEREIDSLNTIANLAGLALDRVRSARRATRGF